MRKGLDLRSIQKGLAAAAVMAAVLLGVGLMYVMTSGEKDFYGETYINGVILFSFFCGSVTAGAKASVKGWQHGIVTGAAGNLAIMAVSLVLLPELAAWEEAVTGFLTSSAAGAAGGVIGVNLPPLPQRRRQRQRYFG